MNWPRGEHPNLRLDTKRVIAEGDMVVTHSHLDLEPDNPGRALADFFRLEDDKVVESWDVIQDVATQAAGFPVGGHYRTPDGVISGVFEQLAAAWDDWITHDDIPVVDGERVVVLGRYSAVNKATGSSGRTASSCATERSCASSRSSTPPASARP